MNTKGNQRYQDTRKKIETVFQELLQEKRLQEITVSEICRLAGIHRTTFYGHFLDTYDCMEKLIGEMYTEMMEHFVGEKEARLEEGFLWLFEFVREHRSLFLGFIEISHENPNYQGLPTLLEQHKEEMVRQMDYMSEEELLYHQEFFSAGLLAMIRRWLLRGCVESPEDMCRILEREYAPRGGKEDAQESR